jgi:hypothetical protein
MSNESLPRTPYKLFGDETLGGWSRLIDPLVARVAELGGSVEQIKEKFGGLRFCATLPVETPDAIAEEFWDAVARAEVASFTICEQCGAPGKLRLRTLCEEHADGRPAFERPTV